MTPLEYKGSFYVWGPHSLQRPLGKLLASHPPICGAVVVCNTSIPHWIRILRQRTSPRAAGRPDQTFTYYRQARAERTKIEMELDRAGHPQAELEGDDILKSTPKLSSWNTVAPSGAHYPISLAGRDTGIPDPRAGPDAWCARRRLDLALFALPAFGLVMFYALFSHSSLVMASQLTRLPRRAIAAVHCVSCRRQTGIERNKL